MAPAAAYSAAYLADCVRGGGCALVEKQKLDFSRSLSARGENLLADGQRQKKAVAAAARGSLNKIFDIMAPAICILLCFCLLFFRARARFF